MEYTYNDARTIRTCFNVEKIYSTNKGFIGRLFDVEYKKSNGQWVSQGSRWLINCDNIHEIMEMGFKGAQL